MWLWIGGGIMAVGTIAGRLAGAAPQPHPARVGPGRREPSGAAARTNGRSTAQPAPGGVGAGAAGGSR